MHIKRILLCASLFILLFSNTSFAQSQATQMTAPILVADTNIKDTKIVNQVGNVLQVSFTLTNGTGPQSGVLYGVRLVSRDKGVATTVDEKIYDEVLSLPEASSIKKSVVYTAPETLSGTYAVYVIATNKADFPFGVSFAGNATFTRIAKGLSLSPNACTLSSDKKTYPLSQAPTISPQGALEITCTVTNLGKDSIGALPTFETRAQSAYGAVITTPSAAEMPIVIKGGETKKVTLTVPKIEEPQLYSTTLSFSAGSLSSNEVRFGYRVSGSAAMILNASLDKDYYLKNEKAVVTVLWSKAADTVSASIRITSGKATCGSLTLTEPTRGRILVEIPVTRSCYDPAVSVTLTDASGKVLDAKTFEVATTTVQKPFTSNKSLIVLALVALLIIALGIFLQKKGIIGNKAVTTTFILALCFFIPTAKAHAGVYWAGQNSELYTYVAINQSVYAPADPIVLDGFVKNTSVDALTISFGAVTVGNSSVNLFATTTLVIPGNNAIEYALPGRTLTAPSAPGSYATTFSVGVDETDEIPGNTPVVGYVFMIGPHAHGSTYIRKVAYVSATNSPIHPAFTVRVKNYGSLVPYLHTSASVPPSSEDQIFSFPAGTIGDPLVQYASCSSNCGIPVSGFNYGVVSSVSLAGIVPLVPNGYHVCKYDDAPGPGMYFSPATYGNINATCQQNYPDAIPVW